MSTGTKLAEARRELKHWAREVGRLQDEYCAKHGHIKGPGAFSGYSYCKTCGSQIANSDFGKRAISLPVIDPKMLKAGKC